MVVQGRMKKRYDCTLCWQQHVFSPEFQDLLAVLLENRPLNLELTVRLKFTTRADRLTKDFHFGSWTFYDFPTKQIKRRVLFLNHTWQINDSEIYASQGLTTVVPRTLKTLIPSPVVPWTIFWRSTNIQFKVKGVAKNRRSFLLAVKMHQCEFILTGNFSSPAWLMNVNVLSSFLNVHLSD